MDGCAGGQHAVQVEYAGAHALRQASSLVCRRLVQPVQQGTIGVQIVGEAVELVDGLGSFLSQPALPLASLCWIEVARGGAERHLARPQRHPRPPGKPLDPRRAQPMARSRGPRFVARHPSDAVIGQSIGLRRVPSSEAATRSPGVTRKTRRIEQVVTRPTGGPNGKARLGRRPDHGNVEPVGEGVHGSCLVLGWGRFLGPYRGSPAALVARARQRRPRPLQRNSAFVVHGVLRWVRARRPRPVPGSGFPCRLASTS